MSTTGPIDTDLHLPDMRIKGFRGIEDLTISRLGRVTLLAGKNGTGKTTVLEAVTVYAAQGRYTPLANLLRDREEAVRVSEIDSEQEVLTPRLEALFHGRMIVPDSLSSIGPVGGDRVEIRAKFVPVQLGLTPGESQLDGTVLQVQVSFQGFEQEFPALPGGRRGLSASLLEQSNLPSVISCESLGPGLPGSLQLARFWDEVALTDEESRAVNALNLIYSGRVERVAMIGDDTGHSKSTVGRRPVVKLRDNLRPVPLKSLGDGAVRLFGVALALANSKDGFLLIDEAENGIHHSIQRDFWTMILKAAHQNNVQVLATTHSWDCVAGFAMAATEIEEVDGALVRLDGYDDRIKAVEYTEDDLRVAAKHGIEVR